mgnify:CR=1 FL=1
MSPSDIILLRELSVLLDLAYLHHTGGGRSDLKSAEGAIRLEFGNLWFRAENPNEPPGGPVIESVVIYSSVFTAARVSYFDTLEDAIETVNRWYEDARAKSAQNGDESF